MSDITKLLAQICASSLDVFEEDSTEKTDTDNCRQLGNYLLDHQSGRNEAYAMFLLTLSRLVPDEYDADLLSLALDVFTAGNDPALAFDADDINALRPVLLADKILKNKPETQPANGEKWFDGSGSLRVQNGVVSIFPTDRSKAKECKEMFSVMDGRMVVYGTSSLTYKPLLYSSIKSFSNNVIGVQRSYSGTNCSGLQARQVNELCRLAFSARRTLTSAPERYKHLVISRMLAEMTDDDVSASYALFATDYLRAIEAFSKGEYTDIPTPNPGAKVSMRASVKKRQKIVSLLQAFRGKDAGVLSKTLSAKEDDTLYQIARLISAAKNLSGTVPESVCSAVLREVTRIISIDIQEDGSFIADDFVGVEDGRQEFKTSFVYPAGGKGKADMDTQKMVIFKGICAFLNTETGGTLYLGVNDAGYVVGIENDLSYLKKNMDSYMRLITDEAKKVFSMDVLANVSLVPMFDNRVVAIKIDPCEHTLVKSGGKAYIRMNGESVLMNGKLMREIQGRRAIRAVKNTSQTVGALVDAIREERSTILHGYMSSHSEQTSDRIVEPFQFDNTKTHIWAFEPSSGQNKLFSVVRINNVEILEQGWTCKEKHQAGKTDIFNMTGTKPLKYKLRLDLVARNLLLDEYPDAMNYITKEADSHWILDTSVYNLAGAGRFYMGLMNHIEVLDAPELQEYVAKILKG